MSQSGGVYFALFAGNIQTYIDGGATQIPTNTWTHIAGTWDGAMMRIYVNGIEQSEKLSFSGPINIVTYPLKFGVAPHSGVPYAFNGKIDEAAIYNRALSEEEINQHYEDGLIGLGYDVECILPPPDLVSWWSGDGNAEDFVDGNHGALKNGATYTAGRVDQAFSFDGLDDYVEVPDANNLDITNELTIDAWFYNKGNIDPRMRWQRIIHKNYRENYEMWIDDFNRKLSFRIGDGTVNNIATLSSGTTIQFDTWYHVAAVYDGSSMKLYLNGDLSNSMSTTAITALGITTDPVIIGNVGTDITSFNHNRPFNGLIDEVEIFNRALLQSEIQAIYLAGSAGKCKVTNLPPVARCKDIVIISANENCEASIDVADINDGSYDPDDDLMTLSIDNTGLLPLGNTSVTLTVTDEHGESDTCQTMVTVNDTTPPEISISVSPDTLRPPNHKMVLITPTISVTDNCDSDLEYELILIEMNEGDEEDTFNPILDETLGDGHTANDIQVGVDGNIYLRAERSGKGDGRIYTITYTATDASGNITTAIATVTVPHDQKK